ncbi:MAG: cobyrinate a,c-diamide synthase [Deltaproteobacteria bacterium]|nr:cobyrinate a,c-diamide synthase [Deltaproteobacteria bacterium]
MHGFLIAAPQSGSGKTTVSLAIMAALCRRGLKVAPFKCGPDFIDPGYHSIVTGRPSINLDGWMCPAEFVRQTFRRHGVDADVAVIEGVMGLFDGIGPSSGTGSSAQIAAITGMPVVLVVNARGMAASAAALVGGFAGFDPQVRLAGVVFNNVGSDSHGQLLRAALAEALPEIAVFGCIPRDESLAIPSRHLGLVTAEDNPLPDEFIGKLADMAERCLDLDRLVALEANPPRPPFTTGGNVSHPLPEGEGRGAGGVRIAVARDAAFCFVYADNLRLLEEAGAELVMFSPLDDAALPSDIQGIYLPGGYPELYADTLASNSGMLAAIRMAVASDMPVYAECGGFVYLTEGLDASEDQVSADFAGIFPVRARMLPRRKALGYRQVELATESVIGAGGAECRGHEFHYSEIGPMPDEIERCYRVSRQGDSLGLEGYRVRNCLASYIHLHFGSNPEIAPAFVASCRRY